MDKFQVRIPVFIGKVPSGPDWKPDFRSGVLPSNESLVLELESTSAEDLRQELGVMLTNLVLERRNLGMQ